VGVIRVHGYYAQRSPRSLVELDNILRAETLSLDGESAQNQAAFTTDRARTRLAHMDCLVRDAVLGEPVSARIIPARTGK